MTAQQDKGGMLHPGVIAGILWVLIFALYFSTAQAGFVADFTGWLEQVKFHSFMENLNRTNYQVHSLYQFTQFNTYIFYKLFGTSHWAWHLLFVTLHAANAWLLYFFSKRLLGDVGVTINNAVALGGAILFAVTPYVSEVVVWEPSFHFLQGLLLILLILLCAQQYIYTAQRKYVLAASLLYFVSLFSLEVFYITPLLVMTLAIFYHHGTHDQGGLTRKVGMQLFLPMIGMFFFRFILFKVLYGSWVSRIGTGAVAGVQFSDFGKPAKYLFHLLMLGRFYPHESREDIYGFCDSTTGILLFYGAVIAIKIFILMRFKKMTGLGKAASLFFLWTLLALLLLVPLWFGNTMLVVYDRYTYFACAFLFLLVSILAGLIPMPAVRVAAIALYAGINIYFTIMVNDLWSESARIISSLLHNIPKADNKTIVLLNLPQSMEGVPMIGAEKNSEYKLMRDLLLPDDVIKSTIYDAQAYNMLDATNGAHVRVLNDSTMTVTLNQYGTWWWFEMKGGHGYWNNDYKLQLTDPGHLYDLTLRKPASDFLLLYQVGDK